MDIADAIDKRKSIRAFKSDAVAKQILKEIMEDCGTSQEMASLIPSLHFDRIWAC